MNTRKVVEQLRARPASDGAGVKLLRVFSGPGPERFDPFLMLDEFGSEEASDYIAGFPPHPHRGFETITYMLQGKMEHRDHMGNVGLLNDGDVQWMTAGKGVIHSEMPKQTEGKMRGFQLWLNLPSHSKMQPAHYADIAADNIPEYELQGLRIKAIAGALDVDGEAIKGYFDVPDTEALYLDLHLDPGRELSVALPEQQNVLVYVYEGEVVIGADATPARAQTISRLDRGERVQLANKASDKQARVLLLAGTPLKEPIVQYGPFVMNTTAEIEQAMSDYRAGTLTD